MFFFLFILFNKSYWCVDFYFKLILIKKIIKQNQVNNPYCDTKYLYLYLSLNFFQFCFCLRKKLQIQNWLVRVSFFTFFLIELDFFVIYCFLIL